MRVTVLGTGDVGRYLAARLDEVGHQVVVGTRDVEATLARPADGETQAFAAWLEDHEAIELAPFAQAASGADLVVNATAGVNSLEVLAAVDPVDLDGVVLLDVANPLDFSAGFPPTLSVLNDDSLGERIQRAHPNTHVVKALNTVAHEVMVDPGLLDGPHEVFVAGDDPASKQVVTEVLASFGWPPASVLDLGPLRAARGAEMYLPLWLSLMQSLGTRLFNVHVVRADG